MLVGVPGRGQSAQSQPTEIDLVPVVQAGMAKLPMPSRRGQDAGAFGDRQLAGTGHEVRVQMGVRGERQGQPTPTRGLPRSPQVQAHVHHEPTPVSQVDQVGGVPQALVDQRNQVNCAHHGPSLRVGIFSDPLPLYTIP